MRKEEKEEKKEKGLREKESGNLAEKRRKC